MANGLSALRLLLAAPFGWVMLRPDAGAAAYAAALICIAIATDFLDGLIARRWGAETACGRALDHTADFLFVVAGLAAAAARGAIPWLLPVLIMIAFVQYVVDSAVLHRTLRTNPLGRLNGILYFVPLCFEVLTRLGLAVLAPLVFWIAWALVLTTIASIVDRLRLLALPARRARGSRGEERPDR